MVGLVLLLSEQGLASATVTTDAKSGNGCSATGHECRRWVPFAPDVLSRSPLPALCHSVFHHRFSLPHPPDLAFPIPCRLLPTSTPLLRPIQFAYGPRPPRQRLPSDGFFEPAPQPSVPPQAAHPGAPPPRRPQRCRCSTPIPSPGTEDPAHSRPRFRGPVTG
jgi:hypothetical protein